MTGRRTFLRGLASLPLIGGGAVTVGDLALPVDPIVALRREWLGWRDKVNRSATSAEGDAAFDRWMATERLAPSTPTLTTAGAIAALEWVQDEIGEHGQGCPGDALQIALLNSVLGLLRRSVGSALGGTA